MQEKSSFVLPEHIRITKKIILNRIMFLCVLKVVCVVQTFYPNKHLCAHGDMACSILGIAHVNFLWKSE